MNIQTLVEDSKTRKLFDISQLITSASWTTQLDGYAGKMNLNLAPDASFVANNGSPVSFRVDDKGLFFGYMFDNRVNGKGEVSYTLYDQSRYLKNKDTYVIKNMSQSAVFSMLCKDFKLKHKVTAPSTYILPPKVHDNKALAEILEYGVDMTLINTGQWFVIYDNFGVLEFNNVNNLKTDLIIGDESLLSDYEFGQSIDQDTYNQIKLVQENKKTEKREAYIVKDSSTISTWGTLQYFEKVDEEANPAQIEQRATTLLKLKNRETKKLRLKCIGDLRVRAGSGVIVSIANLAERGLPTNQYYMVVSCTHNFTHNMHTMDLEMQVSI